MSSAPYLWLSRPGPETLQLGEAREQAEQSADASYEAVVAPPCTVCGKPVADRDWEAHKYVGHGVHEDVLPYGRPDSREVFVAAFTPDEMAQKLVRWRARHPGCRLALAGEGTCAQGRIFWQRFRVFDARGRAAQ